MSRSQRVLVALLAVLIALVLAGLLLVAGLASGPIELLALLLMGFAIAFAVVRRRGPTSTNAPRSS